MVYYGLFLLEVCDTALHKRILNVIHVLPLESESSIAQLVMAFEPSNAMQV